MLIALGTTALGERKLDQGLGREVRADSGLSLVEVIIAMLLLAIIATALLPALWYGIAGSAHQASNATATRFLNSLIEEARELESCTTIPSIFGRSMADGRGATLVSAGTLTGCAAESAATLTISISQAGEVLASTTARIYIP